VLDGARRKGIGSRLVKMAADEVRNRGKKALSLAVKRDSPAVAFYEELGFEKAGEFDNQLGGSTRSSASKRPASSTTSSAAGTACGWNSNEASCNTFLEKLLYDDRWVAVRAEQSVRARPDKMKFEEIQLRQLVTVILMSMLVLMALPVNAMAPVEAERKNLVETPWWDDTVMDRDGDHIHDALEITIEMGAFIDEGRISVLVDFDHTPTGEDETALMEAVSFVPRFRFHAIDIISGTVPVELVDDLLDVPGVVFVSFNGPVEAFLKESVPEHGVDPYVWDAGFDGDGMNIAVIDTGIDALHVGLDDFDDEITTHDPKVIAFYDAINSPDQTDGSTTPYDDHGHGSHCAGISAGSGAPTYDYVGISPGSALIGVKVLDGAGSGSFDQVMAGMQWCIDHREEFNIRSATMSLGGVWLIELTQSQEERLTTLANEMVHEGIALCIAAGNSGHYGSIGTPGAARDVITVGATEKSRTTAVYSSRGPTHEGLIKPNIAAIGSSVMSVEANTGNGYTAMSGTSMATPMVAGIMTLLLEANPDLDPLTVRSVLEYTSEFRFVADPQRPNNDYGWGFVEADAALDAVLEIDPNLKIALDPKPERRNFSDNRSRYVAEQYDALTFTVEGNATHLEWRNVDGGGWREGDDIDPNDGFMEIVLDADVFPVGNHSFWVRATGPDGVSNPVHVEIHVSEGKRSEKSSSDDDSGMDIALPVIGVIIVGVAAVAFVFGRKSGGPDTE